MNLRQKSRKDSNSLDFVESRVVVVAIEACNDISRTALKWALTNVVQPGDCVRLLVVIPSHTSGRKLWGFSKFHSDCTPGYWNSLSGTLLDQKDYITELCNQMTSQLWEIYDPEKVRLKLKVIYGSTNGAVASEAKKDRTHWVVLDKRMKREAKFCMEQLECNIVVVKNSEPKVLRLNFTELNNAKTEVVELPRSKSSKQHLKDDFDLWSPIKVPNVTPTSSPDHTSYTETSDRLSSILSLDMFNWEPKVKQNKPSSFKEFDFDGPDSESDSDNLSSLSTSICSSSADESSKLSKQGYCQGEIYISRNVREMISLNKNAPPDSPPLCSVCRHKSPCFGKPPRLFLYSELELATNGFSKANFLAEGGYGNVHRGVLPNGQVIAVKQHKLASTQGDREFCSEVEVLSCAQHRNVVMLIGYCVEDKRRLLVYEYICNGSLDAHLYGRSKDHLDWAARQKIALGAARGLSYLHEECRVGCIVHRDMRPNNILLTHDFEPLVGDFGLARLQPDGDLNVKTRIIGTFGYLAPEYVQTGQVNEKADVYSFGVVLVELVSGRKAVDMKQPKGEQCLIVWARPFLEENSVLKLVDPCLMNWYVEKEVQTMLHCAYLCLQQDPQLRPRMYQVHRMLDGESSFMR